MAFALDLEKYKGGLKRYLGEKGYDTSKNPMNCFNSKAHSHNDAKPSLSIKKDGKGFFCFGCGIKGDIYEAVGILENIPDLKGQYDFVEKLFGGAAVTVVESHYPSGDKGSKKFEPDAEAMREFENYLGKDATAREQIKNFLNKRAELSVAGAAAYPAEIEDYLADHLFYWPGLNEVQKNLNRDILKKSGIPLANPTTGISSWEHSGVVLKLGIGYKLHYYQKYLCDNCKKNETCEKYKAGGFCEICEKRTSWGGETFPMPGSINPSIPVIVVEGEMNALSCAGAGIKNLFSAGGTNGLDEQKVKRYLLDVPEMILFFDADDAGRKASGLCPLDESDGRKTNLPQNIRHAGYKGKISLAELPPVSETGYKDQDALIIAGKLDVIITAISEAREWVPAKKAKKIYMPFDKFNFLSIKRLKYILENLEKNSIKEDDVMPFAASCLKAFPYDETKNLLEKWGASGNELTGNDSISPYFILEVMKGRFSRHVLREIEREITPTEEYIKHIEIKGKRFDLNLKEIELSHHARNFYYLGGPRSAALMLASVFDGRIIYNDAKNDKHFYFFNGHIWIQESDTTGIIYNTLLSVMVHFAEQKREGAAEGEDLDSGNKKFYAALNRVEDRRVRRDIEFEFAGLEGIYHNSDNRNDALHFDGIITKETLTLLDGVLDFSGDKLVFRESRPEEYRRDVLPYTVEQVKSIKTGYFWKIMRGNFKNDDTLETFMYYLSLIASRVQYKYGAFLIGGKDTGKSTVIQMIKGIYQHLIGFLDADILVPKEKRFSVGNGPTPYIAGLEGLGAAITMETEDGATLNAALWKKLTGNDIIPARGLNEAPKEFANTAQIIIASNMIPRFNRHDPSIIERIIAIPFLVNHARGEEGTERPENIMAELEKEYPGIVRVFAKHYIKLKTEHGGVIPISRESRSYKTDVIAEVETELDEFVKVNISFEEGGIEIIKDIYDKYLDYFGYNEESVKRGEALSRQKFSILFMKNYKSLITREIQRVKGSAKTLRVFVGVRMKTIDEIAANSAAKEKEHASTQVTVQERKQAAPPVVEPLEGEDPFN